MSTSDDLIFDLGGGVLLRLTEEGDHTALADAQRRNRTHLAPWSPRRPESFYTAEGQAARIRAGAEEAAAGRLVPWLLVEGDRVVGAVTLSNVVRGPFQSADLGYWVAADRTGRGLAGRAVAHVCADAGDRLGLHRVAAATLLHNAASQRVLARNGFEPIGVAPHYLHIDGAWRDHRLFQRILHDALPADQALSP
ncbi:GNAT family N-acetyltransferase [Streptomyces millisiae]|uniref:GNAT family N-acetyltransferase n=1 Tax=Streptomyces millisiae TaxID=3075542 RepID=A0ABU2LMP5_9ACTN|nr:GNAT family N-acetyltransferase [Streptomyces sp. DSM 44918]MDT0318861.1 GNAT family N-acetyltransferase [Streptomyces sp. DSM 44918]